MSDPRCAKCGHPRSNHPYRHMFVGPFGGPNESGGVMTDFETHPIGTAERIEELEAKLAKAVEALEAGVICTTKHGGAAEFLRIARTTLAELKGGTHGKD